MTLPRRGRQPCLCDDLKSFTSLEVPCHSKCWPFDDS